MKKIKLWIYDLKAPMLLRSIYDLFTDSAKKFAKDDGTYLAAGMAYYIFFSVFPFLLGAIAILSLVLGPEEAMLHVKDVLERQLPGIADSPIIYENLHTVTITQTIVGVISILALLWSGSAVFGALTRMMNKIWNIEDKRSLVRKKITDMIYLMIMGMILTVNVVVPTLYAIIGNQIGIEGAGNTSASSNILETGWTYTTINVLPPLLSLGMFAFIYKVIPQINIKFKEAVIGAIFGALIFELTKSLFVAYISAYGNFDRVYGSISAVIILLLFSYISSIIVVFFAEISNVLSSMREKNRFNLSSEIIFMKGSLKPYNESWVLKFEAKQKTDKKSKMSQNPLKKSKLG